jgi:hypothetical protein
VPQRHLVGACQQAPHGRKQAVHGYKMLPGADLPLLCCKQPKLLAMELCRAYCVP